MKGQAMQLPTSILNSRMNEFLPKIDFFS